MTTFSQSAEIVKSSDGRYGLRAPKGGCTVGGKVYRGGSFCPPYKVDNPHELPVVEVKGSSYLVEPMTPSDGQVSAVRLIKRTTKEGHEVVRLADGSVACTCPAFHYSNGSMCKHAVHAVANGLVPVAPIEPAPLPVVVVVPEPMTPERRAESRARVLMSLEADVWARTSVSLATYRQWLGTDLELSPVRASMRAWGQMDPDDRERFGRWLEGIGYRPGFAEYGELCLEERFDAFFGECLEGSPVSFPEPGPAPSWDPERFEPTDDEEAEWSENDPAYDAWLDERYAERMAEIMAEPGDGWHESERVAAVGCLQARLV